MSEEVWGNALFITALGSALILSAAFGRALGNSPAGRKVLQWSPAVLALVVVAYVGVRLISVPDEPVQDCIYDSAHPSDCQRNGAAA